LPERLFLPWLGISRAKEAPAELSMLEQRYLAVREVLDTGATVSDVAARHGVDRRTLHRWLVRYANDGIGALAEKSSKPDHCPHLLSPVIEARIVSMWTMHPGWGPRTILTKLRKEFDEVPSRSGIYRALVRQNLIQPKARRRQRKDYKRWERSRSMELWQIDVVERIYLSEGTSLSAIQAEANPVYDGFRQSIAGFMKKKMDAGDPVAAAQALLKIVDSENPPLRVFFGAEGYQIVQQVYANRLKIWSDWQDLSAEAHGMLDQETR
jgi:transposase